jgi:hypothetical protein
VRSLLFPAPRRATEATAEQIIATGASLGAWGRDPIDGDTNYRPAGAAGRAVPHWTLERSRTYSVAAYRANPMARAIIDTYTSFCVGDSGVSLQVTNPQVRAVAEQFWTDPRNRLGSLQELMLRDQLLAGETLLELLTGPVSGSVRFSPIETGQITDVSLIDGNPLWPGKVFLREGMVGEGRGLAVATVDDATGLRDGQAMFWAPFKALLTDRRGMPFLSPILDWLDSYDTVLSNLIDRTALARYLVWDVTVKGDQAAVDSYVDSRGGRQVPASGSVEVHNDQVTWEAKTAQSGAFEDVSANQAVLTSIASGSGLAKTWLAEPEGANRATSHTMAEPVRRRVAGVQKVWCDYQTELVRFAVDRAVAARKLAGKVTATDARTGQSYDIPASMSVTVNGPEIAAADAQITAQVLLNLSTGLQTLVDAGVMSPEAARVAARKAWEDYVGVTYTADLDSPAAKPDDLATHVDDPKARLRPVPATKPAAGGTA